VTDLDCISKLRTKVFGERTVYDNPWVRLTLVDIEPPDGQRFEHHVVRLQTVVLTVVLDEQDRILMLWRHRFATDEWGWELPGGILERGEDPADCAVREVVEETGWCPDSMRHLLSFQPMPGMVDTPHKVYLAESARRVGNPTDHEELGRVDWMPLTQVTEFATSGKMLGSGSLVGLLYLLASRRPALPVEADTTCLGGRVDAESAWSCSVRKARGGAPHFADATAP
jgi:8-oxo-dGDP phosphatase